MTKPIEYKPIKKGEESGYITFDDKTPNWLFERLLNTTDIGACLKIDADVDPLNQTASYDLYCEILGQKKDIVNGTLTPTNATVHNGGKIEVPGKKVEWSLDLTADWSQRQLRLDGTVDWPRGHKDIHLILTTW